MKPRLVSHITKTHVERPMILATARYILHQMSVSFMATTFSNISFCQHVSRLHLCIIWKHFF